MKFDTDLTVFCTLTLCSDFLALAAAAWAWWIFSGTKRNIEAVRKCLISERSDTNLGVLLQKIARG